MERELVAQANFLEENDMKRLRWSCTLPLLLLLASSAWATFHTFRIHELYSNADGTIQYIVFRENEGFNGENLWANHDMTARARGGVATVFTFPNNLLSSATANSYVLVGTRAFSLLNLLEVDYVMPDGFLPVTGGELNFADVDAIAFDSLPTNGVDALYRNGVVAPNQAINQRGVMASLVPAGALHKIAAAVEYYYADWNYYFVTAFADEVALLDDGAYGGVWQRTGQTFNVWPEPVATSVPTCRFFSVTFAPKSSHFYTPFAAECASVRSIVDWQYESIAFHLQLASADGLCASTTTPLYRLYNNGMGGAPNHRYTTSVDVFNAMMAVGWVFEGDGNTKVFACVPK